jgi:hypothetical protein
MSGLIKWWIVWAIKGLKLALLFAAGLAAAGAVYMGWETISLLHPGFNLEPTTRKVFTVIWRCLGHSLQLAMFAYVVINWFPEFFGEKDLRRSD